MAGYPCVFFLLGLAHSAPWQVTLAGSFFSSLGIVLQGRLPLRVLPSRPGAECSRAGYPCGFFLLVLGQSAPWQVTLAGSSFSSWGRVLQGRLPFRALPSRPGPECSTAGDTRALFLL